MMRAAVVIVLAMLCLGEVFRAGPACAAAGALDPTFGQGGKITISLSDENVIANDAVLQPDGKIVVAAVFMPTVATVNQIATEPFGVVRLLSSGSLDRNFGTGGNTQIAFTNFINTPNSLALQSDGKIVAVGEATSADGTISEFAVARFASNGTLDSNFGNGGKVTTNFVGIQLGGIRNPATVVAINPANGQIVVGGSASECAKCVTNTALARYNADGSLDPSFGNGGLVSVKAIGAPTALALLSNGDTLALAGESIVEFGASGSLHSNVTSTITGATIVATSQGGSSVFQPNGDFVFASSVTGQVGRRDVDIQLLRLLPQGSVDTTFNSPVFDFGSEANIAESARALAVQSDGKVVAGGAAGQFGAGGFGLVRFNASGGFDTAFGTAGKVTTPFANATAGVSALLLQPADGKIVAVGTEIVNGGGPANLVAARYLGQ
jgi:uncharacterized delta-60 repeat protein